jgi:hypothetical protein
MAFQGFVRCLPRVVVAGQTREGRHGGVDNLVFTQNADGSRSMD